MASARPYPPSDSRIAEARATGHVPRAPLVGVAAVVLAVFLVGFLRAFELANAFLQLLSLPLEVFARGTLIEALGMLSAPGWVLLRELLVGSVVCTLLVLGASWAAQGMCWQRSRVKERFPRLPPSYLARVLWSLGLLLSVGVAVDETLASEPLVQVARSCAQRVAAMTLLCGVLDVVLARAKHYASLWQTRGEYLEAERRALGAPEVRAARAAQRHEFGRGP